MTDRIIEIADTAAWLSLDNHLLVIKIRGKPDVPVPISEIQCLILANPAVTISGSALAALADAGVSVVVSGSNRLPVSMMLPLNENYVQTERFLAQINAKKPLIKRLWQIVVREKVKNQAKLLSMFHGNDFAISALIPDIGSGDPENIEARASIIYWKNIFKKPFIRDRSAFDNNLLLNYGYAILRAMTARACCCAGLHPTIGINHHNRYDPYCLADDLMEPFRTVIDKKVFELNPENYPIPELDRTLRSALLNALLEKLQTSKGAWSISDLLKISAEQTAKSFMTEELCLCYF